MLISFKLLTIKLSLAKFFFSSIYSEDLGEFSASKPITSKSNLVETVHKFPQENLYLLKRENRGRRLNSLSLICAVKNQSGAHTSFFLPSYFFYVKFSSYC